MKQSNNKAFTLVELLVVIAVISLLASITLASLNSARAKARDAKKIADFHQLQQALGLYFDKYGKYPNETEVTNGSDHWWGNFNSMAQQLVNEGFLSSVPIPPNANAYNYYNYGGTIIGGLIVTSLEAAPPSTTGYPGTCRPFNANTNWCDQSSSTIYCVCNPY